MPRASTVRFTEEMYARLDQASARTGLPVNSIVIAACLDWLQRHAPPTELPPGGPHLLSPDVLREGSALKQAPRWATLRRAVELAAKPLARHSEVYPFDRFTDHAKELLTLAQTEALQAGFSYIGTEHMLLAASGNAEFQSARILGALGVDAAAARAATEHAIGRRKTAIPTRIVPTSQVKVVIELAFKLCAAAGDPKVSTGHLLLALAAEGHGIAAHVLSDLGATKVRIESELGRFTEPEA